ncbi:MAG: aminotransferase class I/II-fold pyridoxal phosphate-dependent enzyme [Propionicimonas sp.]|uniref:MalY/PatB family protein n=1 Tax=Propionicimonas sp. TaxID=1955623 RepID=UPI002B1EE43A|nr:aminotransferase class I/II-fold pyridoxal phosphate-dependent enzyme [Propionicimonas sp.]MEA4945659.1 aminotransferase class I/II-fold pyridoxal phosphate-dependent enzyme [Propionicimonas sp.]
MPILSLTEAELRARRSMKWRAFAPDILPLWVAEMDVALHPAVREVLREAADRGDTGYPHGRAYAEAFAAMAAEVWGLQLDGPRQIKQSGDVMNGILAVLSTTTAPGDRVVINPPVYPPFRQVTGGYDRQIVEVPLTEAGRLDLPALTEVLATRPAAYLLCSPHNPTGAVHTRAELETVATTCHEYGVQLVVDEIHARIVDPGVRFTSALDVPGGEHAVVVTSAGKAWNLPAFKAGLIIGGLQTSDILAKLPPLALQAMGHWASMAHTAAMREAQDWVDQVSAEIAANKVLLAELLASTLPGARYQPGEGTYLAWVDCTALGLPHPAHDFREVGRVAFSPGRDFSAAHSQWVRINLACSPTLLTEAVDRMVATVEAVGA